MAIQQLIEFTHRKIEGSSDLELISKAFRKGAFGSEEFCIEMNNGQEPSEDIGKDNIKLEDVLLWVCQQFQVTLKELQSTSKERKTIAARSALAIITRKMNKWSLEDLARLLNKNSGTISRLASRGEILCDSGMINVNDLFIKQTIV